MSLCDDKWQTKSDFERSNISRVFSLCIFGNPEINIYKQEILIKLEFDKIEFSPFFADFSVALKN